MFHYKSNFQRLLVWIKPHKCRIGPKWGENVIFKNLKWHNIVSKYYYKLTLFLVLIGKFNQKSKFYLWLGLKCVIRAK